MVWGWMLQTQAASSIYRTMQASKFHLSERKLLLSPCLCILRTRPTRLSHPFSFAHLLPLSDGFLDGPLWWVLWQTERTWDVTTTFSGHYNVCWWLQTAHNWGLAIILSDKCNNNFWLQDVGTVSNRKYKLVFHTKNYSCILKKLYYFWQDVII